MIKWAITGSVLVSVALLCALVVLDWPDSNPDDQAEVAALAAVVETTTDKEIITSVLARTHAGASGRLGVHLPGQQTVGRTLVARSRLSTQISDRFEIEGVDVVLFKVRSPDAGTAVIELRAAPGPARPLRHWVVLVMIAVVSVASAGCLALWGLRPPARAAQALRRAVDALGSPSQQIVLPAGTPPGLAAVADAIGAARARWAELIIDERKIMANLSHRLRTPLTTLRLDAEAVGTGPVAERIRLAIRTLETEVDRVIHASGRPVAALPSTCDAAEIVRDRMKFWRVLADAQRRKCHVDCAVDTAAISLTAEDLSAAVDALITNIFRHTEPGTPFSVTVVDHAGWVSVVVDDGGHGIPDPGTALQRGTSTRGSTGLGLDIARDTAESAGGTIHLERAPLGGARVRLRFPVTSGTAEEPSARPQRLRARSTGSRGTRVRPGK